MTQWVTVTHSSKEIFAKARHTKFSRKLHSSPFRRMLLRISCAINIQAWLFSDTVTPAWAWNVVKSWVCSSNLHASVDVISSTIMGFTVHFKSLNGTHKSSYFLFSLSVPFPAPFSLMWKAHNIKSIWIFNDTSAQIVNHYCFLASHFYLGWQRKSRKTFRENICGKTRNIK